MRQLLTGTRPPVPLPLWPSAGAGRGLCVSGPHCRGLRSILCLQAAPHACWACLFPPFSPSGGTRSSSGELSCDSAPPCAGAALREGRL